jgi:hypothetical protein
MKLRVSIIYLVPFLFFLHSGTEQMWDEVNRHYLMHDKLLMYGIAVDDAHHYQKFSSIQANSGRRWIYVKSENLRPDPSSKLWKTAGFLHPQACGLQIYSLMETPCLSKWMLMKV